MTIRFRHAPVGATLLLLLLLLAGAWPGDAGAATWPDPGGRPLYGDGDSGRFLLAGGWSYRADDLDEGRAQHFERDTGSDGWTPVPVPFAWNARDTTDDAPSIGWFRTTFRTPGDGRWRLRFESVNNSATVWLNGRLVGRHQGAYLPWELGVDTRRGAVNRLVVRVDSHHPASNVKFWRDPSTGQSRAGWWNFGGILREVYLRRVEQVRLENVAATPVVRCRRKCSASITLRAGVAQIARRGSHVQLRVDVAGRHLTLGPRWLARGAHRVLSTRIEVPRPRLWSPEHPNLYRLRVRAYVDARAALGRPVAGYVTHVGLRTFSRSGSGRILVNGKPVLLHGASIHEDDPQVGAAWGPAQWQRTLSLLKALHANVVRSHYPLSPGFLELCDRAGILVYDEIPVYQVPNEAFAASPALRAEGVQMAREMVRRDQNHASVMAYSIGNELPSYIDGAQRAYLGAAITAIRRIDRSRLVALDRFPDNRTSNDYSVLRRLDILGVNEYYGWYYGAPDDSVAYLDALHAIYPDKSILITEFGAEANRDGAATEKGTYAFQQQYLHRQLQLFAGRPYLAGALVWALRDFRVRPGWTGDNPVPSPPWNKKGLVEQDGKTLKPAFGDVAAVYSGVRDGLWPAGLAVRPASASRTTTAARVPSGGPSGETQPQP